MFGSKPKGTRRMKLPFESKDDKPYIFASYGHDDKETVFPLMKALYEAGYNVWYDEGITIGEKYDEIIENHIRQSAVFLLFASELSLSRPYVLDVELKIAEEIRSSVPLLAWFIEKDVNVPAQASSIIGGAEYHSLHEIIQKLNELGLQNFGKRRAVPIEREVPQYWFDSHDLDCVGESGNIVCSAEEPYACLAFHPDDVASCNPYAKELFFAGYNVRSCENSGDSERGKVIAAKECKAFVPFVTKRYVESGRLEMDYAAARKAGKPLIALYIRSDDENEEPVRLPVSIAAEFSLLQGLDMRELTNNDFLSKLEAELERRKCYASMKDGKVCRRSFEIRDFLYDFTDGGKKLVLTRYRGDPPDNRGKITQTVKRAYFGFPVKEIGKSAFRYSRNVGNVILQDGIESIAESAFESCVDLETVAVPDSVVFLGDDAFKGCASLREIDLPKGLTAIPKRAFEDCDNLKAVVIPDGVVSIANSAFSQCVELASIKIPDSVETIGDTVFYQCECLTSVVIPDSVKYFGDGVFMWCVSLESVTLSRNMERIGAETFSGCSALAGIDIPEGITSIDSYAFYMADGLTSITVPESVIEIGDYAFSNCDNLECVTVVSPDTEIGEEAFGDFCLVRCPENSAAWEYCEEENIECEPY